MSIYVMPNAKIIHDIGANQREAISKIFKEYQIIPNSICSLVLNEYEYKYYSYFDIQRIQIGTLFACTICTSKYSIYSKTFINTTMLIFAHDFQNVPEEVKLINF